MHKSTAPFHIIIMSTRGTKTMGKLNSTPTEEHPAPSPQRSQEGSEKPVIEPQEGVQAEKMKTVISVTSRSRIWWSSSMKTPSSGTKIEILAYVSPWQQVVGIIFLIQYCILKCRVALTHQVVGAHTTLDDVLYNFGCLLHGGE